MTAARTAPPVGASVTGRDAFGRPFSGRVTAHLGPYTVVLDGRTATPLSLLDDAAPAAAPQPDLFAGAL